MGARLVVEVRVAATSAIGARRHPAELLIRDADIVAKTCRDMAERFQRRGKLVVFGNGAAATDAQHISVEFVHPVIVGKRALPAISLTNDVATITGIANERGADEIFSDQIRTLASAEDIALGISADGGCRNVLLGLEEAKSRGLLTVALLGGEGGDIARSPSVDHTLVVRSDDPRVVKEVHVTTYHILWELVHVFLEQPGVLGSEATR